MLLSKTLRSIVGAMPTPENMIDALRTFYAQNGATWNEVNLFGVRYAKDFYTNKFLDLIGIVTDEKLCVLRATTVPGPYWTPENCKRFGVSYASIMCLGFHDGLFGFTNHRGHPDSMAFGQRVPVPCFIDKNRDSVMQQGEGPYMEPANAGMNMHTQMAGDTDEAVNFASAGCQVAQNRQLFLEEFMPIAHASKLGSQKGRSARFSYFLFAPGQFSEANKLKLLAR